MRHPLFDRLILRVVTGSRAQGLAGPDSDTDRRGVFLPTADAHWSLAGLPHTITDDDAEESAWELERVVRLALKANPTVLEALFSPLVGHATPLGRELLDLRPAFLSKRLHATCGNYSDAQFRLLVRRRKLGKPVNFKHAAHLVRLLAVGTAALRGEGFPVDAGEDRDWLLAVKRGERTLEEVNAVRAERRAAFDAAHAGSPLPDDPDEPAADRFVIRARRLAADSDDLP